MGSIDVIATHINQAAADAMEGLEYTEISAREYKSAASEHGPLSDLGRKMIADRVVALSEIFVSDVARYRGVSFEEALSQMADGRVFLGRDAISRGLADGVSTLDEILRSPVVKRSAGRVGANSNSTMEAITMPIEEKTKEAEVEEAATVVADSAVVPAPPAKVEGEDLAAKERARIQGVLALSVPGAEAMINSLAFDGKTTPDQAEVAILSFQKQKLEGEVAALTSGAGRGVQVGGGSDVEEDATAALRAKWDALPSDFRASYKDFDTFSAALTRTAELKAQGRVNHFHK